MKKLKLYKTSKIKKRYVLSVIPLSLALLLSSCKLEFNNKPKSNGDESVTHSYNDITMLDDYNNQYEDNDEKIIISDQDYYQVVNNFDKNEFQNYINNQEVYYSLSYLYDFSSSLAEYNKVNLENYDNNSSLLSYDEIRTIILNNNKEYLDNKQSSFFKEIDQELFNKICKIICDTVADYVKENPSISRDRIIENIKNIKIFEAKVSTSNAYVTDDNVMAISTNMMNLSNTLGGPGADEAIITHEVIHFLQKASPSELSKNTNMKKNYGFSYEFDNLDVNSLNFSWLYEASAEKNVMNYMNRKALVYEQPISYLESLSMANLLNENFNVNDTEKLSFKHSIDDLYAFFNATTESEKMEILNMMYSIEIMQFQPKDFYSVYEKEVGKKVDDSKVDDINYTVKSEIFQTLTKIFYKNLSECISNNSLTLDDIFYLINVYENDISSHLKYSEADKYQYNNQFLDFYVNMQDNFFYTLSNCTGKTQEEIEVLFENSKDANNNIRQSAELSFMENDKKQYLNERLEFIKNKVTVSVRDANKQLSNNKRY